MGEPAFMIAGDLETSKLVAERVKARAKNAAYSADIDDHCSRLFETMDDPSFPGALIPDLATNGSVRVIAAAKPADWRRLSPVLRAFAGPTLTSFDGLPSARDIGEDLAGLFGPAGQLIIAVINVPSTSGQRDAALRALVRLCETFARAPALTRAAPEPTSWLLARFQDNLNVGRRDAAVAVLDRLRDELRLDALNLKALQVQLLATFDEWAEIISLPGFTNLVAARRTPVTTALLLEALYRARLDAQFEAGDEAAIRQCYVEDVRPLALPLLAAPLPASLRIGGWRLVALEVLFGDGTDDLRIAAAAHAEKLGWVAKRLPPIPSRKQPTVTPIDEARERIVVAEGAESIDTMAAALEALSRLTEGQRRELSQAEPFRSAIRALEVETASARLPASWGAWLDCVGDPGFTNALDLARHGAEEWPIADAVDPVMVGSLVDKLNAAQANPIAAERTAQALPYLVAALKRDPAFPQVTLSPIYSSLLTLLALGSARAAAVYDSSLVLVDAILSIGSDAAGYRDLVADVEEIAGDGFGVGMVYWALELVEAFMREAAPDVSARDRLVHGVLARLMAIRSRLSALQVVTVSRLAQEFGWEQANLALTPSSETVDDWRARLSGKRIAIYSLVENATRQAKLALEAIAPNVEVDCSADSGGTSKLRALATNSDLFVIAWAAAKHAATDFIREHRSGRPLVYAEGKGVSSILRSIEEFYNDVH